MSLEKSKKFFFLVLLAISPKLAASSETQKVEFLASNTIYCVAQKFRAQVPDPMPLGESVSLTEQTLKQVANGTRGPMREAIATAAKLTLRKLGKDASTEPVAPTLYFDAFVSELADQLPKFFSVSGCPTNDDLDSTLLADSLWLAAVNDYFSKMIGKGKVNSWFEQNGGTWVRPAFFVTMLSLEISGHKSNLDTWAAYHWDYTAKFRDFAAEQRRAAIETPGPFRAENVKPGNEGGNARESK